MSEDLIKLVANLKEFNSELMELNIKYTEEINEKKKVINELLTRVSNLEFENERLNKIIDDLLKFISEMFDEDVISKAFNMTTKEFMEYTKSKLLGSDKE